MDDAGDLSHRRHLTNMFIWGVQIWNDVGLSNDVDIDIHVPCMSIKPTSWIYLI